ncbi:hypothetical protein SERLA73DRAFT_173871 [Serpula lacrymans var. lacrymans S7.3]|uniref:Large ribosomal subunit protein uL4m n=2 Tax=Serpula lacrymans var. lacrymans TaxID=341189 RepID=F8PHU7_SERL3|nr:uncharacterized protein SERLADRAFT_454791 [Serpula lacrymans var. lacrymans S7.9]EGO04576.1 hypothetical protein SERLA73DRAFT_173871 [Serpula lacrymans var. lacrymans S7.3]EGO30451.1 hypothetical protein SERLADRAFT_454791 [Serpula lacrymans var. lacrymans S7.9]
MLAFFRFKQGKLPLPNIRYIGTAPANTIEVDVGHSIHAFPEGSSICKAVDSASLVNLTMSNLFQEKKDQLPINKRVVTLDSSIFNHPLRRDILHLCVVHHLDSLRQGLASTRARGEVRGSNHKIRPQKGSGRARLGDSRSPILRGGGVAFGPKQRDFSTRLNAKVIRMGMRVALTLKVREQRLGVVSSLTWFSRKTVVLKSRLQKLGWDTATLFVTGQTEVPANLRVAGHNIPGIDFKIVQDLKVYDLVKWRRVVLDTAALCTIERILKF